MYRDGMLPNAEKEMQLKWTIQQENDPKRMPKLVIGVVPQEFDITQIFLSLCFFLMIKI